ncbi:hypothetical protein BDA99DRAFT_526377 [Phascolomyces articulosus]|uniref:Uncharacterized protein n=1 Tax=Phascolomyces articulosus TaxID=60185 RepID=A0AAD5JNH9_9FUNG|nr:hypothetical protein BDA99DRAFT_526377 [Phascolomyces articulosus]
MSQVCSNCLQTRDIIHFQEPTRSYKTCDKCRANRKRKRALSSTFDAQQQSNDIIQLKNINNTTTGSGGGGTSGNNNDNSHDSNNNTTAVPLITLGNLNENFTTMTMNQLEGFNYEARISLDDTLLGLSDMDIAKLLCSKLGECDSYKYILKTVNPSTARKGVASFYANCSQSLALAKSKSNSTSITASTHNSNDDDNNNNNNARRRNSRFRKRFDCKGRVSASIDRIARLAHVMIQHNIRHEPPEPSRITPNEVRAFIRRETTIMGRSAKDIHADVRQQFPNINITSAQVYYWWREFKQEVFEMDPTTTSNTSTTSAATNTAAITTTTTTMTPTLNTSIITDTISKQGKN